MSENILGKVPPHSIEAEHTLLGSILIDKEALEVSITTTAIKKYLKQLKS